jgi:hypothetical protein
LLDLIESQVKNKNMQVVATTHSPYLLGQLSDMSLEHALLLYRPPGGSDAQILRVLDMPDAKRLIETYRMPDLFASGWFESTALYLEPESEGRKRRHKPARSRKPRARR